MPCVHFKFVLIAIGMFDDNDMEDMIKESIVMKKLNHPNVMQLLGVCVDAGSAPYIVLPFMPGQ